MNNSQIHKGYFDIARESADISLDLFKSRYLQTEQPVIIEQVTNGWDATSCWTEEYIRKELSKDKTAKAASLWYWMERGTLENDYKTPNLVEGILNSSEIFKRTEVMRIWIHALGNVSSWHYDANMVSVFNVQVTGQKEWILVSPQTPIACYPFVNFGVMGETDKKIIGNRTHCKFTLSEGDMLYLPPLWFHKVTSCKEENISLNWIFTKKETNVSSKTLIRELERYSLQEYLSGHKYKWIRNSFNNINQNIPGYLRWKWRYPEMIKTTHQRRSFQLTRRTFNEIAVLGKVARYASVIKPYIDNLKTIKKLTK